MTDMVARNVDSAVSLIDRLLELARAGQEPREPVEVDVRQVVDAVLEQHATEIAKTGVRIEVEEGLGTVRAEPTHVFQLFSNLIGNALRHAGAEGARIRVSGGPDGAPNRHRFRVRDSGPGIPEESLPHVFESFYRGTTGGSGLGLAIAARIVSLYGGELRARNEGGAVFEFTLHDRPAD
jgi:signal transduction histidine kinase